MKFEDYCKLHKKFTTSQNAYRYCKNIKDSKKVRAKICDGLDVVKYCLNVKDRKSVRAQLKNSLHAYLYCRHIENRQVIKNKISCHIQLTKLALYLNGENEYKYKYYRGEKKLAA